MKVEKMNQKASGRPTAFQGYHHVVAEPAHNQPPANSPIWALKQEYRYVFFFLI